MLKQKLLKDFFKKAYKNNFKNYKDTLITRKEVKKELKLLTLKRYCHILAMWN
jgi:DNA-directed RNA polymerase subunit N (RpoN/RPB10)